MDYRLWLLRLRKLAKLIWLGPEERQYSRLAAASGLFDPEFYRGAHPWLHPLFRRASLRHFILWGEQMGLQPNPDFSPETYLRLNPDVEGAGQRPFLHFLQSGLAEGRPLRAALREALPDCPPPRFRFDPSRQKAPAAIALHLYYPDLWEEFVGRISQAEFSFDLFVTLTWRGAETADLQRKIKARFPDAFVSAVPNKGRDILPFLSLLNAGAFDGYKAVLKLHSKKSPHRPDGDDWRRHLLDGVLPATGSQELLGRFLSDDDAGLWVADGQDYLVADWWGSNQPKTEAVLRRVEADRISGSYRFPAGSIYWAKPRVLQMLRAARLGEDLFEEEKGQVDGTLAHAVERAIGGLAAAGGWAVRQTSALAPAPQLPKPKFVSAFYLPQFHPIPENDAWWGAGYTEWRATQRAMSMFPGHLQPMLPGALGYYDLRATETMAEQARLAKAAGIDAFCVYHYWFDPKRVLEQPLDKLLRARDVDFPFFLCWANESWRRNWDGLSGEVLLEQAYSPGFGTRLAESALPYMQDPRYARPDGTRPRFMIYRPEDMPDPVSAVNDMREAWRRDGLGEVELGAVAFHMKGNAHIPEGTFDFFVEMPPHGLVGGEEYLFGGPLGNQMGESGPRTDFRGLIYDYAAVARKSLTPRYRNSLPANTIAGVMPSWDNTARRGLAAHIAYGGTPASFRLWLQGLRRTVLTKSYRQELFINAWNEWAEKAVLEPSEAFGTAYLDVLREEVWRG